MSMGDIDFARELKPYPALFRLGLLLSGLLMIAAVGFTAKNLQDGIAAQTDILYTKQQVPVIGAPDSKLNEAISAVERTQLSLQTPWLQSLAQLEKVKAQHPDIHLLAVMPNRDRAEIIITGEAKRFDTITAFLEDVKRDPQFSDAVLQSQHLSEDAQPVYSFNAQLVWRLANMGAH